ncbi:MAG: MBL fold metallo-hydrolase [bacterium]|nr:MBL fold metallo-hydrolase [bacterium]
MGNLGLRILPVGQLETNCYLVFDREASEGLIIDPGDDADYIMRAIGDEKIRPLKILATHGHFDHLLGATELQLNYQIPFLIHSKDKFLVKSAQRSAEHFLVSEKILPPPEIDEFLKEGQKISFGKYQLEVMETPGHTPGGVCFHLKKDNILFCGDTVFKEGVGRTDFSYSSSGDLEKSLQRIFSLPEETTLYPGHGEQEILYEKCTHRDF